jgi:hypothetical protein
MYILDFYNVDGTRFLSRSPPFSVLDVSEQPLLKPVGETPAQYFYISGYRKYEIHDLWNRVIRKISFPPMILVT